MFDDSSGGLFDFDGDGTTDIVEESMGYAVLDDMMDSKEEEDFDSDL